MGRPRKTPSNGIPPEWLAELADASLRERAGATVFVRGLGYADDGLVELVQDGGTHARFDAFGSERYQVGLSFEAAGLNSDCSCPHAADGFFCKHQVAAAIAWRRSLADAGPEADAPPAATPVQQRIAKAMQTRRASEQALQQFLAQQPAEQLAARLWAQAQADRNLMAELKAWAAVTASADDPAALRQAVDALLKVSARQMLDTPDVKGWVSRALKAAELLRQALPRHATEVRLLAEKALRQAVSVEERAFDDPGEVDFACEAMFAVMLEALRAAPPPATWAEHVLQRMQGLGGVLWQRPALIEAAGAGVARAFSRCLAERWQQAHAACAGDDEDADPKGRFEAGPWNRDSERGRLRQWMITDLQRQGDPLAVFEFMRRSARGPAEHVALIRWCNDNGRQREGLQLAQAACKRFPRDARLDDLLLAAYERDGWDDEVLAIRLRRLDAQPSPDAYGPLLVAARAARADVEQIRRQAHARTKAWEDAAWQRQSSLAQRFLRSRPGWAEQGPDVSWRAGLHVLDGDLDAALKAVHPPHRCDVRVLEALADRLPAERDDEAFALLQRCFEHAMAGAKSPYAEPLRLVARAMLRLNSQQAKAFVLSLGQAHRAKRNFIAGLPPVRGP